MENGLTKKIGQQTKILSTIFVNTSALLAPGQIEYSLGPRQKLKYLARQLGGPGTVVMGHYYPIPCNVSQHTAIRFRSSDGSFDELLFADEFVVSVCILFLMIRISKV